MLSHTVALPNTHSSEGYLIPARSLQSHFACVTTFVPSSMASLNTCGFELGPFSTVCILHNISFPLSTSLLKLLAMHITPPRSSHISQGPLRVALISAILQGCDVCLVSCILTVRTSQQLPLKYSYSTGHFSTGQRANMEIRETIKYIYLNDTFGK